MTAIELLASLHQRGIELTTSGDRLRFRPVSAVTPKLAEAMRRHKAELLGLLSGRNTFHRCTLFDYRVRIRTPDALTDDGGDWLRTKCSQCGRFFGYRPSRN